jgi:hypothetical protein
MGTLLIKNFPDDLRKKAKKLALDQETTLREYIICALLEAVRKGQNYGCKTNSEGQTS